MDGWKWWVEMSPVAGSQGNTKGAGGWGWGMLCGLFSHALAKKKFSTTSPSQCTFQLGEKHSFMH